MDLTRYFSVRMNSRRHQTSPDPGGYEDRVKRSLPLLASPINENAREALSQHSSDLERAIVHKSTDGSLATTSFTGSGRSSGNLIIYKEHHEASTIELFYDLYFVANLGDLSRHSLITILFTDLFQRTLQLYTSIQMPNV